MDTDGHGWTRMDTDGHGWTRMDTDGTRMEHGYRRERGREMKEGGGRLGLCFSLFRVCPCESVASYLRVTN